MSTQTFTYDPENWLISAMRSLGEYVKENVGEEFYNVIFEFPSAETLNYLVPQNRSIIHFEIDDIENKVVGFGDNIFRYNYDAATGTVKPQEGREHFLDLDVGIWSWDKSGGTTSRLRAYQVLTDLFNGARAYRRTFEETTHGDGGLEIQSWTGGRFLTEQVNDMLVYRTVDATLRLRVYSRTPSGAAEPAIVEYEQDPDLSIYTP